MNDTTDTEKVYCPLHYARPTCEESWAESLGTQYLAWQIILGITAGSLALFGLVNLYRLVRYDIRTFPFALTAQRVVNLSATFITILLLLSEPDLWGFRNIVPKDFVTLTEGLLATAVYTTLYVVTLDWVGLIARLGGNDTWLGRHITWVRRTNIVLLIGFWVGLWGLLILEAIMDTNNWVWGVKFAKTILFMCNVACVLGLAMLLIATIINVLRTVEAPEDSHQHVQSSSGSGEQPKQRPVSILLPPTVTEERTRRLQDRMGATGLKWWWFMLVSNPKGHGVQGGRKHGVRAVRNMAMLQTMVRLGTVFAVGGLVAFGWLGYNAVWIMMKRRTDKEPDQVPTTWYGFVAQYVIPQLAYNMVVLFGFFFFRYRALHRGSVRPTDFVVLDRLGEGQFGTVYRGVLTRGAARLPVAIKQLKDTVASRADEAALLWEADMMMAVSSEHVGRLEGLSYADGALYMLIEFVEGGDLRAHVRRLAQQGIPMPLGQRLFIAAQIANGMAAVAAAGLVHRDLAARNCMVQVTPSGPQIKISDFGLAQRMGPNGQYVNPRDSALLPLCWSAPEALKGGVWSEYSDVYAFGITWWELEQSTGETPMRGKPDRQMVEAVVNGLRPVRPPNTPTPIWQAMSKCWHGDVRQRPSFKEIEREIAAMGEGNELNYSRDVVGLKVIPSMTGSVDGGLYTEMAGVGGLYTEMVVEQDDTYVELLNAANNTQARMSRPVSMWAGLSAALQFGRMARASGDTLSIGGASVAMNVRRRSESGAGAGNLKVMENDVIVGDA